MTSADVTSKDNPRLVIVADDLTGAADSAARSLQAGLIAEIWLEATQQGGKASSPDAEVVSVSTDSRFLAPGQAAERVAETVAVLNNRLGQMGATWYKKIDSTLRGNLGAELDAMVTALPAVAVAVVCPAFPAQGRGLEGGKLVYVGAPPRDLPALLRDQSRLQVGAIDLATVRGGIAALTTALQEAHEQGDRLLVIDGMTEGDLEIVVGAAQAAGYLLCGSAGLVAPLAARLEIKRKPEAPQEARVTPGPILALVGSGSSIAHAQVAQVQAAEAMRVRELDKSWYEVDLVGAQSHPVGDWLIHLAPPAEHLPLDGAVARAQAVRLADLAYAAVGKLEPSALLVVGGDTAQFVLRRLGIERLRVEEELLPGIPLCFGVDGEGRRRAVVLKPGNFGDAQTLVALHDALHERQSSQHRSG